MQNVAVAIVVAAGFALTGASNALAGDPRIASFKQQASNVSYRSGPAAQSRADGGAVERKCMVLPCGTTWCYNVKR